MKNAIEFKDVGECKVIRSVALKKWTFLCRIIKHKNEYKLVEYTLKGKQRIKVAISKKDAEWLIETFSLRYVESDVFRNSGSYLMI